MCRSAVAPATSPVSTQPDFASFLQQREFGTDRPAVAPSAACQLSMPATFISTPAGALLVMPKR
jgi:hypothetical protein